MIWSQGTLNSFKPQTLTDVLLCYVALTFEALDETLTITTIQLNATKHISFFGLSLT